MPHILAQVTIPYKTGIPEDVTVNTWSFEIADTNETNFSQVGAFLNTFYSAIDSYMSPVLDLDNVTVKAYDRSDPEPRTPFATGELALPVTNDGPVMPEEVAVCLSFRGVLASGAPPARRRGRVYLGPLSTQTIVAGGNSRSRVAGGFIEDVIEGYEAAWAELTTAGNVHEVWSPTDEVGRTVVQAWVDNEFDTQRRRGTASTNRVTTNGPW